MTIISVKQLKEFTKSQTTYDEWLYDEAIGAAEAFMADRTDREWVLVTGATTATARYYRPVSGSDILWVHDAASITSVVENGTTLTAGTDYVAEPLNNLSPGGAWRPTDRLIRCGQAWYSDGPKTTVTVTAEWGWSTFPSGLVLALYVAAKAYLEARDVSLGLVAITEQGAAGQREAKAVADFIDAYRGHASWGVA